MKMKKKRKGLGYFRLRAFLQHKKEEEKKIK
jgi:hypothetical protein